MQLIKETWSSAEYLDFIIFLKSISNEKNAEFSSKIIPSATDILGVKIPELRKIAQEILKGNWRGFLKQANDIIFEELLIQGIIIGKANTDYDTMINLVESYLPKINNWALCDCFCSNLKITIKNKEKMLCLIKKCIDSKSEYTVRFAVVMLINYYIDEEHINLLLQIINRIYSDSYYVRMSVAWAISACYIKFPQETEELILKNDLDDFTLNKAIDKIRDSFRVPIDAKNRLKKLKRNKCTKK